MVRWAFASFGLVSVACTPAPRPSSPPASAPAAPSSTDSAATTSPAKPTPIEITDILGAEAEPAWTMPLATEVSGWRALWIELDQKDRYIDLDPHPTDDVEAREWMCSSGEGDLYCEGPAPWIVELRNDRDWIFHVVTVGPEGFVHSESFGLGGLTRCGANTEVRLEHDDDALRVVVEDYFQFPFEECECDPDDEEDCECMTGCGDDFEATCTFTVDPESLEFGEPDASCSALDVGEAAGYEI